MESEPMFTPREKSLNRRLRGGSNPRCWITQDSEASTLPTELFRPSGNLRLAMPCQTAGVTGSVHGLVGPVSVYCDSVGDTARLVCSFYLSEAVRSCQRRSVPEVHQSIAGTLSKQQTITTCSTDTNFAVWMYLVLVTINSGTFANCWDLRLKTVKSRTPCKRERQTDGRADRQTEREVGGGGGGRKTADRDRETERDKDRQRQGRTDRQRETERETEREREREREREAGRQAGRL